MNKLSYGNRAIVVVENDLCELALIEHVLTRNHYKVASARSSEDALRIVSEHAPIMVIADVHLPERTALELCEVMKKREGLDRIPFVFVSRHQTPEEFKMAFDAGAVFYVGKNQGWDKLLTAVNLLVAAHNDDSRYRTRQAESMAIECS